MKKNNRNEYINTSTSLLIGSVVRENVAHSLYRTNNYKYKYVISTGDLASDSTVADISFESAKNWAFDNLTKEDYEKEFLIYKSDKILYPVSFHVDGDTYRVFEKVRGNTGKSISDILVEMINYYEQTHGSLND